MQSQKKPIEGECPICVFSTSHILISENCFHGACKDCIKKIEGQPCYYCRGEVGKTQSIFIEDYKTFVINDTLPDVQPFEVLFGSKLKRVYEIFRDSLIGKWCLAPDLTYKKVCEVCILFYKHQEVDTALLTLFYACATITRTSILDAMTCLGLLFGFRNVSAISPKDVYFHFFLNHCITARGEDEDDQSNISDFVTFIMHSLIYDVPEIDETASFISTMPVHCGGGCNTSRFSFSNINNLVDKKDEDEGMSPFIPEEHNWILEKVGWDNSYKWKPINEKDEKETINCLGVLSNCPVCVSMMDYSAYPDLMKIDGVIQQFSKFKNIETAVVLACKGKKTQTAQMVNHYTNQQCKLNTLRFIHIYSLVKQPSSFKSGPTALYLLNEIFKNKRAYVCPIYHLACFSDRLVKADSSQMKKTKRDSIQRWAVKIFLQHSPSRPPPK